ncbi:MAG: cation transporter [Aeromonadaceae bacterium]
MFSLSHEAGILRWLVLIDGSFAALGVVIASGANSQAVWLDALFSLLCAVMIAVESGVVDRLREPATAHRPNGLAACEPLLMLLKGVVLSLICLFTLGKSVHSLLTGGHTTQEGPLIAFGLCGLIICGGLSLWLGRKSRELRSPILATEQHYFRFDALISLGVMLAFGLAMLLKGSPWQHLAGYMDPLLSLLMVAMTLPSALQVTYRGGCELLCLPADTQWQQSLQARIGASLTATECASIDPRLIRQGRRVRVQLYWKEPSRSISSEEAQRLCQRIHAAIDDCAPLLSVELVLGSTN